MYKIVTMLMVGLLFGSCANSTISRGSGDNSYASRDAEVVFGDEQTYPRIALVMGNNDYEKNKKLTNAVPDARAMRDFFRSKGFRVIYTENADKDTMNNKVNEFMNSLGKKSVSIVYYAGHAVEDKSKQTGTITNYLLPINDTTLTTITDYDRNSISMNYILSKADDINHGLNIAMIDACRTSIGRGNDSFENIKANGVYLVYSTDSGVTASDSGEFRKSFLKYANSSIKLNDIFLGVKRDLIKTGQKPIIQDKTNGEFFYFNKPKLKPIPTPQIVERIVYRNKPQTVSKPQSKWITPTKSVCESGGGKIGKKACYSDWNSAKKICRVSGGRLPTKEVLRKIVTDCGGEMKKNNYEEWIRNSNNSSYQSCYKQMGFTSSYYWSSTTDISDTGGAWGVGFNAGGDYWDAKTLEHYVRCVRGQ